MWIYFRGYCRILLWDCGSAPRLGLLPSGGALPFRPRVHVTNSLLTTQLQIYVCCAMWCELFGSGMGGLATVWCPGCPRCSLLTAATHWSFLHTLPLPRSDCPTDIPKTGTLATHYPKRDVPRASRVNGTKFAVAKSVVQTTELTDPSDQMARPK
jgi:hypothetical protein